MYSEAFNDDIDFTQLVNHGTFATMGNFLPMDMFHIEENPVQEVDLAVEDGLREVKHGHKAYVFTQNQVNQIIHKIPCNVTYNDDAKCYELHRINQGLTN